jgi:hypothetical protein
MINILGEKYENHEKCAGFVNLFIYFIRFSFLAKSVGKAFSKME